MPSPSPAARVPTSARVSLTASPWPAVDRLAQHQYGIITLAQCLAGGLSVDTVKRATRAGRLVRVHAGVYRLAGAPPSSLQSIYAGTAATAPGSAASHRSAARLWDLDVPRFPRGAQSEVTVPRTRAPRLDGVVVHRSLDLRESHVLVRKHIRVTNPLRLLADLGAVAGRDAVAHALAQLLSAGTVTMTGARAFHAQIRKPGRNGSGVLGTVLESRALGDARCESVAEELFAELAARFGILPPIFQYRVMVAGKEKRIDFAYPELMIAVEIDGWDTHGALPAAFYADRARSLELTAAGWLVVHLTWHDLTTRPAWVAQQLSAILASAAR
jgi:very-short-patch-repair endonuclease